ncbi:MAG: protein translocase subunit SecF [Dehalococcoidia bacterium]|nr:protein translocase subunit SecF [Dehalococcoidia bacterium]
MRVHRIDLVHNRGWLFLISGGMAVIALILLAIPPALKPGIEFSSGSTALYRFETAVTAAQVRDVYREMGHTEARIQSAGTNEYLVRTSTLRVPADALNEVEPTPEAAPVGPTPIPEIGTLTLGAPDQVGDISLFNATTGVAVAPAGSTSITSCPTVAESIGAKPNGTRAQVLAKYDGCAEGGTLYRVLADGLVGYVAQASTRDFTPSAAATPAATSSTVDPDNERAQIEQALREQVGPFTVREFAQVSPVVSTAAVRNAAIAVLVASLAILMYIAFAFRSVPRPFLYGTCAIVAMLHDVIITLGIYSFFGKVFDVEVNLMFVTGLLTVIGFSVHDTIVVFDRIRENVRTHPTLPLATNVNAALLQTLARSFNTSITVMLTVMALLLLGGETIREFLLVILVGIISGTYSSVAVAAQMVVAYEEGDFDRLWARIRGRAPEAPAAT